jgi:hypothetical protein
MNENFSKHKLGRIGFGVALCQTEFHLMFGAKINVVGVSDL